MQEHEALEKMIAPGTRRKGKFRDGVIQICITRVCDKACFGCTQGSNLAGKHGFMSLENFEQACYCLQDYFGVVGVFGGNPAAHPQFEAICDILRHTIPTEQCGLWCNNPLGKGEIMRRTFNPRVSNLNVHMDQKAFDEFKRDWPESMPFGLDKDSRHSPPYVAMQDVIDDESKRWELISNCDINQHWSAYLGEFRGELRAYFCEIAGAQAAMHQHEPEYPDLGMRVTPDWWKKPMQDFADQVRFHCHACGVPLRGYGELAQSTTGNEQVSKTHADVFRPKVKDRPVQLVTNIEDLGVKHVGRVIDYLQNAKV